MPTRLTKYGSFLIGAAGNPTTSPAVPLSMPGGNATPASAKQKITETTQCVVGVRITWSGTLTTAATITFYWSADNVNWIMEDTGPRNTGTGASPGADGKTFTYLPPLAARGVRVDVANKDASVAIGVLAMSSTLDQ
jgi:hypothetical protein